MRSDGINTLTALRALTENKSAVKSDGGDSFSQVMAKIEKEQEEWDAMMDQFDVAQYRLALADSFWSKRADPQKYIKSYMERHGGKLGLEALEELSENVSLLNHLNDIKALNGSVSSGEIAAMNRKFSSALASAMAYRTFR